MYKHFSDCSILLCISELLGTKTIQPIHVNGTKQGGYHDHDIALPVVVNINHAVLEGEIDMLPFCGHSGTAIVLPVHEAKSNSPSARPELFLCCSANNLSDCITSPIALTNNYLG